jgi:hypothetical protein
MWLVDGVDRILFSEALAAEGAVVFQKDLRDSASKASCRKARAASTRADQAAIGSRPKTRISRGRDRLRTTGPHWLLLRLALASRRRRTGGGSSD